MKWSRGFWEGGRGGNPRNLSPLLDSSCWQGLSDVAILAFWSLLKAGHLGEDLDQTPLFISVGFSSVHRRSHSSLSPSHTEGRPLHPACGSHVGKRNLPSKYLGSGHWFLLLIPESEEVGSMLLNFPLCGKHLPPPAEVISTAFKRQVPNSPSFIFSPFHWACKFRSHQDGGAFLKTRDFWLRSQRAML